MNKKEKKQKKRKARLLEGVRIRAMTRAERDTIVNEQLRRNRIVWDAEQGCFVPQLEEPMSTPIKLNKDELRGTDQTTWNKPPSGSSKKEQPAAAGEIIEWNEEISPPSVRDANGWRTATAEEITEHYPFTKITDSPKLSLVEDEARIAAAIKSGEFIVDFSRHPTVLRDDTGGIVRIATLDDITNAGGYPPPEIPNWNEQLEAARARIIQPEGGQTIEAAPPNNMFEVEEKKDDGPTTFEEAFDAVIADLRSIMMARQRKYGKKNIQKHRDFGVAVRISDKEARIHNAYFDENGKPRPKPLDVMGDESLDDTFVDIANYGVIALMVRNGTFDLPLKENK